MNEIDSKEISRYLTGYHIVLLVCFSISCQEQSIF